MHQHLPSEPDFGRHAREGMTGYVHHDVRLAPGSRLSTACAADHVRHCPSWHHQGIEEVGPGLVPVGWADDGLVEAVERPDGWVVGVQWHPEETAAADRVQQAIFDAFASAVERFASERGRVTG